MKLSSFLRGLGIGMVCTALILCISYRKNNSSQSLVEQAKELGMVFPEGTKTPVQGDKKEQTEASQAPKEAQATPAVTPTPQAQVASGGGVNPGEAVKATESPLPKPTQKPSPKPTKDPDGKVSVDIREANSSTAAAKILKEKGLIKSVSDFDQYLEERDLAGRVRGGVYRIKQGSSYKKIANIITHNN